MTSVRKTQFVLLILCLEFCLAGRIFGTDGTVEKARALITDQKQYNQAASMLEAHLKRHPDDSMAWFWLAVAHYDNHNQYMKVIHAMTEALSLGTPPALQPWGHTILGWTHYYTAGFEDAVKQFDLALSKDKSQFNALKGRGIIYTDTDKPDLAIRDLTAYLKQFPDDNAALGIRGKAFLKKGSYHQALEDLKTAQKRESDFWRHNEIHITKGWTHHYLGQYEAVLNEFETVFPRLPPTQYDKIAVLRGKASPYKGPAADQGNFPDSDV